MPAPQIDFAWGRAGLAALLDQCDVFVILDVLCFTTSVDVAVARGAEVLPFPLEKYGADEAARRGEAVLAKPRAEAAGGPSLSPASLQNLAAGTRLLLPSPNGSALSAMVGEKRAFAASLRNATAVAAAVQQADQETASRHIAVIAAGEHWPGGALRPAIEDLLGAGAVIARLKGALSAEARAAAAAYRELKDEIAPMLRECLSGQELIAAGFPDDVELAAQEDVSAAVPALREGRYVDAAETRLTAAAGEDFTLRVGDAGDDPACGSLVGAAAATSSYAPRAPHAAALLGDRSPLSQDDRSRIVAESGGELLGFVEFSEADGYVKYLFVHPEAQGRGIGAALLSAAEEVIAGPVTLKALSLNDKGLRWYMKRGYSVTAAEVEEDWQGRPAVWLTLRNDKA